MNLQPEYGYIPDFMDLSYGEVNTRRKDLFYLFPDVLRFQ